MKKFVFLVLTAFLLSGSAFGQDPAIHVTSDGDVAIGGSWADSKLHVWGGGIRTDSYFGFYGGPVVTPTDGAFIGTDHYGQHVVCYSHGVPSLTVSNFMGNALVGIGTGAGQQNYPLHIKGDRSVNPMLKLESTNTGSFIEYKTYDVSGVEDFWFVGANGPYPDKFWFANYGAPTVFFDKAGYNGFLIAEPEAVIHIGQPGWGLIDAFRISSGSKHLNIYEYAGRFFMDANSHISLNPGGEYVGIGTDIWPSYPLHMASGAHVTVGGVWTNASSRDLKENIRDLTVEEALAALSLLTPKKYNYKLDKEDECLGFIAEDVPDLVATKDRKGMSSMDVVALLTKIVQEQQKRIEELESRIQ